MFAHPVSKFPPLFPFAEVPIQFIYCTVLTMAQLLRRWYPWQNYNVPLEQIKNLECLIYGDHIYGARRALVRLHEVNHWHPKE